MSLQVWLPLTDGTLKQQGLSDVSIVNSGATYQSTGGKLGGTYSFGTGASSLSLPISTFTSLSDDFSVACWIKILSWNTSYATFWGASSTSASWANIIAALCRNGSSSKLIFCLGNDSQSITSTCSTVDDIQLNTWYHFTCVYKSGKAHLYQNGVLVKTVDVPFTPKTNAVQVVNVGKSRENTYQSNCLMNDFRIYNHALSKMEIKQLSQGLVLHYKLSDSYIESTTNLITTEDCLSSTCYNGSTSKYGYGTTTNMYKTVTTYDGRKGTKVYAGTDGTGFWPYVYIDNMYTSNGTNSPAYKTLSFDYYTTISTAIYPYKLGSGSGTATYKVSNSSGIKTGMGTDSVVIPVVPNEWNHVEITFHGTTDADAQWGYIRNYPSHTSDTSNFWFFANMQLETKDHATGYAGVGGSRTSTTIYDNSGFCNNGTTSGTLSISNDTPLYSSSTVFNGTNSYVKVNDSTWMVKGMHNMTVNLWAKSTTWPTNGGRLFSCTETGGFNLEAGNSGYWRFPVYVYTNEAQTSSAYKYDSNEIKISDLVPNEWNMITLVYDTTGTKTYLNGQLHHTYTNTSYGINFNTNARLFLGCEASTANPSSPYFNGMESDFRIYATALSAEDIKQLYQDRGYVDNNGNVYGTLYEL